jgi:hypothetical protein
MTTWTKAFADRLPQGPYNGSREVEWTVNGMHISLRLADLDRLGCLLEKVVLKPTAHSPLDFDPASLGQRFRYLGETLAIIEQENEEGRVILRSSPPSEDVTHIYFFELVVDRNEGLSLARYAYNRGDPERKMISAPLTTHALGCLVGDLERFAVGV